MEPTSTCDLAKLASASVASKAHAACCSHFLLDGTCASQFPVLVNGTGHRDDLSRWCFSTARDRLTRETVKWLSGIRDAPNRPFRPERPASKRRFRLTSQHKWFKEWQGCFGCSRAGDASTCCSGQGKCVMGVCACHDGSFGVDCATPQSAPASAATKRSSLAIYVYQTLPIDLGAQSFGLRTWLSDLRGGFEVYSTEWRFLDYLLRDTSVRTIDPEQADLYFVPTLGSLGRMPGSEGRHRCTQTAHIEMLAHHVRSTYPYWDRSGGRDHVFFLTGDQGACGLGSTGTNPIFITAWGLLGVPRKMEAFERFRDDFADADAIEREIAAGDWCHAPHKDVVVPPYGDVQFADATDPNSQEPFELTLLHVGGVWGAGNHGARRISFYSQGMRQLMYLRFGDQRGTPHGFWFQNRSMRSELLLAHKTRRSKFCFSPSGHGWGMRTGKNAVLGCVPLIAQPYVVQPYEMLLPYEKFSRRIEFEDICLERDPESTRCKVHAPEAGVMKIVNASDLAVREMRRVLARVRRAFVWRLEGDGLSYNHTVLHLCQRALELRGRLKAGPSADCAHLARGLPESSPTQRMPKWFPITLVNATLRLQARRRQAMSELSQTRRWRRDAEGALHSPHSQTDPIRAEARAEHGVRLI